MKTILLLLLLASVALPLPAQQPAALAPATNRDEAIRRLLDQAYSQQAATNPAAARATNALVRTNGITNGAVPAGLMPAPRSASAALLEDPAPGKPAVPVAASPAPASTNRPQPPAAALAAPNPLTSTTNPVKFQTNLTRAATNALAAATNVAAAATTNRPAAVVATPGAAPQPPRPGVTLPPPRPATNTVVAPCTNAAPTANVAGQVGAGAGAGAGVGAAAGAAAAKPATNAVDEEIIPASLIKFQEADLVQVLEVYQDLTGRTILRPSTLPPTKITIRFQNNLTRRETVQALDSILSMNGITMIPQGGDKGKFVKAVPSAEAFTTGSKFHEGPASDLPESGTYVTEVVQLKNAVPTEIQPALTPFAKLPGQSILAINSSSILILRDYAENVKRMLEIIEKIDIVVPREIKPVVIPIKYALAGDIAQVLGTLTAGGGGGTTTVGGQQTRTGLTTGSGGGLGGGGLGGGGLGGRGGVGGVGGYGGGAYGNVPGAGGYSPQGGASGGLGGGGLAGGAAGRSSFSDRLRNIVQRASAAASGEIVVLGQTKIIADERTNSLLIFATDEDIETIKDIISKLDVVLAQVLIESLIFEVSLDDTLSYGVSYLQRKPSTSGNFAGIGAVNNVPFLRESIFAQTGTNNSILPSGLSYFARLGGDFDVTAQAIASDSRINVLSRPRIQTSHAVEANLFVGETRPYITGTYSYFGGGGPSSQYSQLQIGITLSVLPLINVDGLVVMDIRQRIQSVTGTQRIDNNDIPVTSDREANAKVAVKDRETIVLGGFISNDRSKSASGVPLLKDIPILGNFFRSTRKETHRKELMILMRPSVLPTPTDASAMALEEKARMRGVTEMEQTALKEDRNNQRKAEKALLKRENLPE